MEDKIFIVFINLIIYAIILIMQILMPKMTRKNIFFGIRVPEEERENKRLKEIYKTYIRKNILVSIPVVALLSYWAYKSSNIVLVSFLPVLIYIGILFLVYLDANYRTKELKDKEKWEELKDEVVIDIRFSKERISAGNIPAWWFVIPVLIALANLVIGLKLAPSLPKELPSHWDLRGNVDGYMDKTKFIWLMSLTQFGMAAVFFFIYKAIGWAKQEISSKNPKESVKRNIIFRGVWSLFCLVGSIFINLIFTLISFYSFGILGLSMKVINIFLIIFTLLLVFGSIIISLKLGQGGSRLKIGGGSKYIEEGRDDDRFWKLGNTIYYNPEDPVLFVEKRFGVGWTVNAGKPLGMFLMILPVVIILVVLFIAIKNPLPS